MHQILDGALAPRRLNMWLLTVFALSALLLAALGIYGDHVGDRDRHCAGGAGDFCVIDVDELL